MIISSINLKDEYELTNDMFFQWTQLKHAISTMWKTLISSISDIAEKNCIKIVTLLKEARILSVEKLSSKKIFFDLNFKHR